MNDPATISVTVNGSPRTLRPGISLKGLIAEVGLEGVPVAAEVNKQVIPFRKHEQCVLSNGDLVELVTLVGGG
jgi:thiamine biosynthesis protein ThiS